MFTKPSCPDQNALEAAAAFAVCEVVGMPLMHIVDWYEQRQFLDECEHERICARIEDAYDSLITNGPATRFINGI